MPEALIARLISTRCAPEGRDYALLNRRCRCRLTEGCKGWYTFHYCRRGYRVLAEPEVRDRWLRRSVAETLHATRVRK